MGYTDHVMATAQSIPLGSTLCFPLQNVEPPPHVYETHFKAILHFALLEVIMRAFALLASPFECISSILNAIHSKLETSLTRLLLSILTCGPIPRHIAFVMDGNRRYAREKGLRIGQGHGAGFESLKRVQPALLPKCNNRYLILNPFMLPSRLWRYACG